MVIPAASIGEPGRDFSGESISIELNPDLVERLERDVIASFKSITKRGSEVGGILLGQIGTNSREVRIEDYELIECGYTRGPLYLFSDAEKQRLNAAIRHWKGNEHLTPVGFFRSNTRKDLVLDDDDASLMNACFIDSSNVFLLIKPFSMKPCVASFFTWEDGRLQETPGWAEFVFKRSELAKRPAAGPVAAPPRPGPKAAEERVPATVAVKVEPQPAARVEPPALPPPPEKPPAPGLAAAEELEEVALAPAATEPPAPESAETTATGADLPPLPESAQKKIPAPAAVELKNRPVPRTVRVEPRTLPAAFRPPTREKAVPAPAASEVERPRVSQPAAAKAADVPPPAERIAWAISAAPAAPEALPAREERTVAEEQPAVAVDLDSPPPAAEAPKAGHRLRLIRWVSPAVAGFVLFAGGILFQRWMVSEPSIRKLDSSSLALSVERSAGQLRLSWHRHAELIRTAGAASLLITDGSQKQVVNLSMEELRSGTFVYSPGTSDVSFRMELTSAADGRIVGESIRSLVSRPSALGAIAPVAPPPETPAPKPEVLKEAPAPVKDRTEPAPASPPAEAPADVPPGIE